MTSSAFRDDDTGRFDRPSGYTRPRTKERPTYPDAVDGFVVTVDRGRFTVRIREAGPGRVVFAVKARHLGRKGVVVGDDVRLVGDTSGDSGSLARIVEIGHRRTVLRRSADDDDPVERIIVANANQLVIVVAVADPEPRTRLIDRILVAAYDARMTPLLCVTKADLADPSGLLSVYRALGVSAIVTRRGDDLAPVEAALRDQVSVLIGHSGVGKSTLVNALVPGTQRPTGVVNAVTGRGRHTSTSVYALELPFGGWVVDTPGVRGFGLAHVDPRDLIGAFDDLDVIASDCPRGCTHAASEPECALDEAVATGRVDPERVASYRRLLESRESPDPGAGQLREAVHADDTQAEEL